MLVEMKPRLILFGHTGKFLAAKSMRKKDETDDTMLANAAYFIAAITPRNLPPVTRIALMCKPLIAL